jgi:hypothetical protein
MFKHKQICREGMGRDLSCCVQSVSLEKEQKEPESLLLLSLFSELNEIEYWNFKGKWILIFVYSWQRQLSDFSVQVVSMFQGGLNISEDDLSKRMPAAAHETTAHVWGFIWKGYRWHTKQLKSPLWQVANHMPFCIHHVCEHAVPLDHTEDQHEQWSVISGDMTNRVHSNPGILDRVITDNDKLCYLSDP